MPRNKRHGNMAETAGSIAVLDNEENDAVSTDTADVVEDEVTEEQDTQFEFFSEPAPEDYTPDRRTPGRVRRASYFDNILRSEEVFEKGWQRVAATSEEHKAAIIRELNRAKMYLNKEAEGNDSLPEIGLDLDEKQDDAVYYKSRTAQKRARKAKDGETDLLENEEQEGLNEDSTDRDA